MLKFNDHGVSADNDRYEEALERFVNDADKLGTYAPTILVGLGGTGAKSLQHVRRMVLERFGAVDRLEGVSYLSVDTDVASARPTAERTADDPFVREVSFGESERIDVKVNFRDYLGPSLVNHPHVREWWDPHLSIADDFNLEQGAGQIRPLSRLVFFGNRQKLVDKLDACVQQVKTQANTSPRIDPGQKTRVVIVAGLAGGTGSGMFLDFAALVRQVVPDCTIEGYLVTPGVYRGAEGVFPKIAANGYAALRELNHMMQHPFRVRWGADEREVVERGLFDRVVLFTGTNASGQQLGDAKDCYALIGEQLFLDFAEGGMARWVQGVRINRAQYLMRSVDREYRIQMPDGAIATSHAESWKTAFQTFGMSKIVFPSWRLLSYAAYDLAGHMVATMDPARGQGIGESLTELRDAFAFQAGFFQGERVGADGERRTVYQVVDALRALRGARTGAATFEDNVEVLAQEMVDASETMFENGASREDMGRLFREVQSLVGDPGAASGAGDWTILVRENRKRFVKDVAARLADVIETFRQKPQVGPSGVAQLLDEMVGMLERPADRAPYTEWFQLKADEKAAERQAAYQRWTRQVDYAVEAHSGFFKSADNHREAVRVAAEAFRDHWQAAISEVVAAEAQKALAEVRRLLVEQADRLRRVGEAMLDMRAVFERYRDFFAQPARATSMQELPVPPHLQGKLLDPYLGTTDAERQERLDALLARGLRALGLDKLTDLEAMLRKKSDVFRQKLFQLCFQALKGENGQTDAFRVSEDEDHAKEGFIQRYSVLRMLGEAAGDDVALTTMLDRLFTQGLPWVKPRSLTGMGLSDSDVPKDCFVGFDDGGDAKMADKVMRVLTGRSGSGFRARRVKVSDPSELIFYTEMTAFPAAYVSELYDDNGLQRYYDDTLRAGTALHLHQDYAAYQDLLPLDDNGVRRLKQAWKVFILAMMLGRVRTELRSADDETRFDFVYQRRLSAFEQRWESLGQEAAVIRRLSHDGALLQAMSRDVDEARAAVEAEGRYPELLALADYYFHCIYPVERRVGSGQVKFELAGSAENEAALSIRDEWRERATHRGRFTVSTLNPAIAAAMQSLADWARPLARTKGRPTSSTADLPSEQREFEWVFLDTARGALPNVQGYVAARNTMGERVDAFPRLYMLSDVARGLSVPQPAVTQPGGAQPGVTQPGITRPGMTPPAAPRAAQAPAGPGAAVQAAPAAFHYAGLDARESGLSGVAVAERVSSAPGATHRVWRPGMDGWADVYDVPALAALLPPREAQGEPSYHVAVGQTRKGELGLAAVVNLLTAPGADVVKVWQKGWPAWQVATDVAEIAAAVPPPALDEPPPLDMPPALDEPPPL